MKTIEVRDDKNWTYLGIDDREKVDRVHGSAELKPFIGKSFDELKQFCAEKGWRVRVLASA